MDDIFAAEKSTNYYQLKSKCNEKSIYTVAARSHTAWRL